LQKQSGTEVAEAHIDLLGTPTERFWANPAHAYTNRTSKAQQFLSLVYPEKLQPLCDRLDALTAQVRGRRCFALGLRLGSSSAT